MATTTATQIQQLYVGLLGRAADQGGLNWWADQVTTGGKTLEDVRASFVTSTEYTTTYGAAATRADLVTSIYQNLFERTPSADEVKYWAETDTRPADQLVAAFIEFAGAADQAVINNKTFVAQTYTDTAGTTNFNAAAAVSVIANVDGTAASVAAATAAIANGTVGGLTPGAALIAKVAAVQAEITALEKATAGTNATFDTNKDGSVSKGEAQGVQGLAQSARDTISLKSTTTLSTESSTAATKLLDAKALVTASGTAAVTAQTTYDAAVAAQKVLVGNTAAVAQVGTAKSAIDTPASENYTPASANYKAASDDYVPASTDVNGVVTAQVGTAQVGTAQVGTAQVGTAQVGNPQSLDFKAGQTAAEVAEANAVAAASTALTAVDSSLDAAGAATTYAKLNIAFGGTVDKQIITNQASLKEALNTVDGTTTKAALIVELQKVPAFGQAAIDAVSKEAAIIAANRAVDKASTATGFGETGYVAAAKADAAAADLVVKATAADAAVAAAKVVVDKFLALDTKSTLAVTELNTFKAANADKVLFSDLTGKAAASVAAEATAKSDVFYFTKVAATNDFNIGGTAATTFGTGDSIVLGSGYTLNTGALTTGNNSALEVFFVKGATGTQVVIETNAVGSATTVLDAAGNVTAAGSPDAAVINLVGVTADHLSFANGVVSYV